MRQAFDSQYIVDGRGNKVGIATGADYCAEHEWGIKPLRSALGMDDALLGADRYRIREWSHSVRFDTQKNTNWIVGVLNFGEAAIRPLTVPLVLFWRKTGQHTPCENHSLFCEWDETGCRIVVQGEDNVALLQKLYADIQGGNGFLMLAGSSNPFSRSGLTIIGMNDIPDEQKRKILAAHEDFQRLTEASVATGIERLLQATHTNAFRYPESGCRWYALSPRWAHPQEQSRTKYAVVYWLNPQSQDQLNAGWFTVEELTQWAQGTGPVIKRKS